MLRFTKNHEWIRVEGEEAVVGITEYAQQQLGDIVFVELPSVGRCIDTGEEAAVVESVKAASSVYMPVRGEIVSVNEDLSKNPQKVNTSPEGEGWMFRMKVSDVQELEELMGEASYLENHTH